MANYGFHAMKELTNKAGLPEPIIRAIQNDPYDKGDADFSGEVAHAQPKPKRHNAKFCPLAIRERIVNALAAGDPKTAIAKALHVSPSTVYAIAEQEWAKVESRKSAYHRAS